MIRNITFLISSNIHAIIFSISGTYVTGWPLASARWYMTYLIGLVLVWTLPKASKRNILIGYGALIFGVFAKSYFLHLTPTIEMQTIPIAMYKEKLIQKHPYVSEKLEILLKTEFKKDIDIVEKNPKALNPGHFTIDKSFEPILYDFKILHNWMDKSKTWLIPSYVKATLGEMPFMMVLDIKSAKNGILWPNATVFEETPDKTIKTYSKMSHQGFVLKDHIGSKFFIPYVKNVKNSDNIYVNQNWIYIELNSLSVYIPLILLIAALFLSNVSLFPDRAFKTIEQIICISIAFITICIGDIDPYWDFCVAPVEKLASLANWIHNGIWSDLASESPLWYGLQKIIYPLGYFGYLMPILYFWVAAWAFLQLIRLFFTPRQSYIIWAILLATPWLARHGMGLHIYKPFYISYNSLMLGVPLFLIGLLGYLKKFSPHHSIAWIMAFFCSPVLAPGIFGLFLHKQIGKYRYAYIAICAGLYLFFNHSSFLNVDKLIENPVTAWILSVAKNDISHDYFQLMVTYLIQSHTPFFIICSFIPTVFMAFSQNLEWKKLARVSLIMHGAFLFDGTSVQDAYLACTLSTLCATIILFPYYERLLFGYQKLAAKS